MKLYKITKWIYKIEIALAAIVILGGFYDHSFWLYGTIILLLPMVFIMLILLVANFLHYSENIEISQSLKKMIIVTSILLVPVILLVIYLLSNPIDIPIG